MTVILAVCVSYTLLGGFRAVIGTDFIQAVLIVIGLVIIAWLTIDKLGFGQIHAAVAQQRPELLSLMMPAAIMFLFNTSAVRHRRNLPFQCLVEPGVLVPRRRRFQGLPHRRIVLDADPDRRRLHQRWPPPPLPV